MLSNEEVCTAKRTGKRCYNMHSRRKCTLRKRTQKTAENNQLEAINQILVDCKIKAGSSL